MTPSGGLLNSYIETLSVQQTEEAAGYCAELLKTGDVVFVAGGLGTGKTAFVRGACKALGVVDQVTSPTYTIGQLYTGPTPVAHVDLYRLDTLEPEDPALLDDYLTVDRVSFVEWPQHANEGWFDIDRVKLRVDIEFGPSGKGDGRLLRFTADGDVIAELALKLGG